MSFDHLSAITIDGKSQAMSDYRGQVLLIVNVASKCGFTNQYSELEALYQEFKYGSLRCIDFGGIA